MASLAGEFTRDINQTNQHIRKWYADLCLNKVAGALDGFSEITGLNVKASLNTIDQQVSSVAAPCFSLGNYANKLADTTNILCLVDHPNIIKQVVKDVKNTINEISKKNLNQIRKTYVSIKGINALGRIGVAAKLTTLGLQTLGKVVQSIALRVFSKTQRIERLFVIGEKIVRPAFRTLSVLGKLLILFEITAPIIHAYEYLQIDSYMKGKVAFRNDLDTRDEVLTECFGKGQIELNDINKEHYKKYRRYKLLQLGSAVGTFVGKNILILSVSMTHVVPIVLLGVTCIKLGSQVYWDSKKEQYLGIHKKLTTIQKMHRVASVVTLLSLPLILFSPLAPIGLGVVAVTTIGDLALRHHEKKKKE